MGGNYTRMELHDPAAEEPAKKKVSAIAERLRSKDGGGLISIFYHPCEWVHQQFWDGVNFARGANPPREEWKPPPQRTAQETDAAFERFGRYIDHIRTIPGIQFITAEDLPELYPDRTRDGVSDAELGELASRITASGTNGLSFEIIGQKAFSLADQFELLTKAVTAMIPNHKQQRKLFTSAILGPDQRANAGSLQRLSWTQFRDALLDVNAFVATQQRVPSRVFIGADPIPPGDFLFALASAYQRHGKSGLLESGDIPLGHDLPLATERYIAKDTPNLFGGWIIHKEGFRAPKILEIARLQTWTLKPALRKR